LPSHYSGVRIFRSIGFGQIADTAPPGIGAKETMDPHLATMRAKDKNVTWPVEPSARDLHHGTVLEQWVHAVAFYPQTQPMVCCELLQGPVRAKRFL